MRRHKKVENQWSHRTLDEVSGKRRRYLEKVHGEITLIVMIYGEEETFPFFLSAEIQRSDRVKSQTQSYKKMSKLREDESTVVLKHIPSFY